MGLKGYRLWVMGQLDSNVQEPHHGVGHGHVGEAVPGDGDGRQRVGDGRARGVALQVAFERRTLKPVFSLDRL
jgi:hypothetical protein